MPRFGAARYLSCFYCGKRSGLKYDGRTSDFLCLYCDATNYLDENGEITDPPVATDREAATTKQYAAPRPSSPAPSGSDNIFCATCLKNQHLFTKMLAQYFPDDPSDPEYEQLERNYYRYRRSLEQRYPQVCDECAARVEHRIRLAGYTAKTDHLRRMMDLSRGRKPTRARTALDWVSGLGAAVWRAGFVLQMLWHLLVAARVLQVRDQAGMRDPDGADSPLERVVLGLSRVAGVLPAPDVLMRWSVVAACASAWWNPHFVQVNRGFTRHLLGFTQWYSFQGLIIFFRLVFRRVQDLKGGQGQSAQAQVSAHATMAAVMGLIYALAGRSIRVDTSPLFATDDKPVLSKPATTPAKRREEDSKTFSELFSDALKSTNETSQARPASLTPPSQRTLSPQPVPNGELSFGSLGLSETPAKRRQPVEYADEMDWSPIPPPQRPSQHRAFANQASPTKGGGTFAQPVAQPGVGNPFRHKVPAAPVNPARRLRNPPREAEPKVEVAGNSQALFASRRPGNGPDVPLETSHGVEFRHPKFFAPQKDDASSLADLLSQSFSLSQEQEANADAGGGVAGVAKTSRRAVASRSENSGHGTPASSHPMVVYIVAGLTLTWLLTVAMGIPRQLEVRTAILLVAGIITLCGNDIASQEIQSSPRPGAMAYLTSAVGFAELAAVCWISSKAWEGSVSEGEVGMYGLGLLGAMLARTSLRKMGIV